MKPVGEELELELEERNVDRIAGVLDGLSPEETLPAAILLSGSLYWLFVHLF